MVGWVGPRTEGPFPRGFRPPGSPWGWLRVRTAGLGRNWAICWKVLLGCGVGLWLCSVQTASAWDNDAQVKEYFVGTAHPLDAYELRLAYDRIDVGLPGRVAVGTHTLPWLVLATNAHVKWTFLERARLRLAVNAGAYRLNTRFARWIVGDSTPEAVIYGVPLDLLASHSITPRLVLNHSVGFGFLGIDGNLRNGEVGGVAARSNLLLRTGLQWHADSVFSFTLQVRYLAMQVTTASGVITSDIDDQTSVNVESSAGISRPPLRDAFGVTLMAHYFFGTFGFALGINYGLIEVPALAVVIPTQRIIPSIDLYWRL